jgi:tripartite-type tricarboxylate transporter receptor subunit TctC
MVPSIAPRHHGLCLLLVALLALPATALACDGARVRLVVPFLPGGVSGTVAEALALRLPERLGTPIAVDYLPGQGGARGTAEFAATAGPCDVLVGTVSSQILVPALNNPMRYDPVEGFAPIALVGAAPLVLGVGPSVPARTVHELVVHGRRHGLRYGSSGVGSVSHVAATMFARLTNVRMEHVVFDGSAANAAALAAGRIDVAFDNTLVPHVAAGRVKALAVTSRTRLDALPGVPTLAEAGVPGYDATTWVGLYGAKRMTPAIAEKLDAAVVQVLRDVEVRRQLAQHGVQIRHLGPPAFAAFTLAEVRRWKREIQLALAQPATPPAPSTASRL